MKNLNVSTKAIANALALSAGLLVSLQAQAVSCIVNPRIGSAPSCTTPTITFVSGSFFNFHVQSVGADWGKPMYGRYTLIKNNTIYVTNSFYGSVSYDLSISGATSAMVRGETTVKNSKTKAGVYVYLGLI